MKKFTIILLGIVLILMVTALILLAETGLKRSNETIERVDRHIEMAVGK